LKGDAWELAHPHMTVTLRPPDAANPNVCTATLDYPEGAGAAVSPAIDAWARTQTPPLAPVEVDAQAAGAATKIWSWTAKTPSGDEGVAFNETLAPATAEGDEAILSVTLTPSPQSIKKHR
jgi:hypothetical protein